MTGTAQVEAGGGVVHRGNGGTEYLVVHRPRYDDWSLPKGKRDEGETLLEAACREVEEETGLRTKLGPDVGTVAYRDQHDRLKSVRYWLMALDDGSFAPNSEVDAIEWLPVAAALDRLSYPRDRRVLAWADERLGHPERGRMYLVRHAYAGVRGTHDGPDRERPVSGPGWRQVEHLTELLGAEPVTRVLSSPFTRCVQSVASYAATAALPLETDERLGESVASGQTDALLGELTGQAVVISTHGDHIEDLLRRAVAGGTALDGPLQWPKGSVWILSTDGRDVRCASYRPPHPAAD